MDAFTSEGSITAGLIDNAEAETLAGDIRDALLTHVRSIKVPWAMLAEDEQQNAITAISRTAEHAIRQIAALMARRGFPNIVVDVGKWTVKDGIKLEVGASSTVDNINHLAEHGTGSAVLVLVEAADFMNARAPALPDKDQPDLIDDRKPKAA